LGCVVGAWIKETGVDELSLAGSRCVVDAPSLASRALGRGWR